MNEPNYLILQCGVPFIYKPAYFQVPNTLTANTYNFIIMQNKTNNGIISLTKNMSCDKAKYTVKLSGSGPVDYSKLSKRKKRLTLNNYDYDSDEELYS